MFCMHTYPYYGIVSATGDVAIFIKTKGEDDGFSWPQPEATSSERVKCKVICFSQKQFLVLSTNTNCSFN